jgi:Tfp pilus assembly protein PilF
MSNIKKISLEQKISLILFGLFLTIVILEIGLRIGGLAILSIQEYRNTQSIKQKGSFRIMCLGESTTQGQYPPYLEEILNKRNIGIKFSVIDKGIPGINTRDMLSQLSYNIDKYQPDMVITMMGINDSGAHMPYEKDSNSKIVLTICSSRAYKLIRIFWLHIITKLKEKGFYLQNISKQKNNYQKIHRESKIELISEKNSSLTPKDDSTYVTLGWFYTNQGKLMDAEQSFKKAIELNLKNKDAYEGLGWLYRGQWRLLEVEQSFKKAEELNSNNGDIYNVLGQIYKEQGKITEAEQLFKKAIELNSTGGQAYIGLGQIYKEQGKITEAEQVFKKAIEFNPNNTDIYNAFGNFCIEQGKITEAEQVFKKAIELTPDNDRLYGSLATIYCEIGNNELSEVYAKKAESLRGGYLDPDVINNYHVLKQILDKRKIKLVCVQYPVRSIRPLKNIFKEEAEGSIIFVDNEKIFKDAIRKEGYKEYFRDMFGGDFGHCTKKGNRLLAENIANTILK